MKLCKLCKVQESVEGKTVSIKCVCTKQDCPYGGDPEECPYADAFGENEDDAV